MIQRRSDSMLRDCRIAVIRSFSNIVTLQFFAKISFRTLAFTIAIFQLLSLIHDYMRESMLRTNIDLNTQSFAFLNSSRLKATRVLPCSISGIAALALPDGTSISSSCLPSLVNTAPRYLNICTCFKNAPPTCRKHWSGFLEK